MPATERFCESRYPRHVRTAGYSLAFADRPVEMGMAAESWLSLQDTATDCAGVRRAIGSSPPQIPPGNAKMSPAS